VAGRGEGVEVGSDAAVNSQEFAGRLYRNLDRLYRTSGNVLVDLREDYAADMITLEELERRVAAALVWSERHRGAEVKRSTP
jgi:hypothetical protein